jgi:hypothetical protein
LHHDLMLLIGWPISSAGSAIFKRSLQHRRPVRKIFGLDSLLRNQTFIKFNKIKAPGVPIFSDETIPYTPEKLPFSFPDNYTNF